MTRSDRSFPIGPRVLAVCAALVALLLMVQGAGAAPSADQVDNAQQAFFAAKNRVEEIRAEIAAIQRELTVAVQKVEAEEGALEKIQADVAETQARLADAEARYEKIRAQLSDRAAEAFMSGPGSSLGIVLGASSLTDLSDRLEFVDAVSRADADLAQDVANLEAALQIQQAELKRLEAAQKQQVADVTAQRDAIMAKLSQVSALQQEAERTVASALSNWHELDNQRKEYLQTIAQQSVSTSPHTSVDLPKGFVNPLRVCPVDNPRAFGDGFGAPRYAGGFHLHAGNDIVSNYGVPIRAPFDGTAKSSYNALGGNSEYVYGASGYVYNAHLDHYAPKSNGPVKAGDIIGYVGDTGDAIGTPHDHFEWHPYTVPANWPASFYGYVTIGSAVNPYPVLVDVCG
jgi:peptidoglycan hydrolase CwlO-like protein